MHRYARPTLALAVAAALVCGAGADVVVLKNGQRIEGVIIRETPDRVVVRQSGGELALPRAAVDSIERDDPTRNAALKAEAEFRAGNLLAGLRTLLEAEREGAEPELLDRTLRESRPLFLRALLEQTSAQKVELRYQLGQVLRRPFITASTHVAMAQVYWAAGGGAEASDALMAGREALGDMPNARDWAVDFLRAHIRQLVREAHYRDAVEQIERLRVLAPDAAGGQEALMVLSEAARARDARDFETALKMLAERLYPLSPEVARNRMVVTLRALTSWASFNERERDARAWIREYTLPYLPLEAITASHRLIETEATRLMGRDQFGLAMRLLDSVPEEERPDSLKRLSALARFETERVDLRDEDPVGYFQLAQWAGEQGLHDEALAALEELRKNPTLKTLADDQASLLKRKRDTALLDAAVQAYDRGLVHEALETANKLLLQPDRESQLAVEAEEIAKLARRDLELEDERRPYQAEAFFQQAERAYFMENLDESWNLIDVILTHYGDTPAAQRAANLLPSVAQQLELQLLEGRRRSVPTFERAVEASELQATDRLAREIQTLLDESTPPPTR